MEIQSEIRSRTMKKIIIPASIVTGLLIVGLVIAGCARHRMCASPEKKAGHIAKHVARQLDLTAEQKVKLDRIKNEIIVKTRDLRKDHMRAHTEVLALVKKQNLSRADVDRVISKREAKFKEMKPFIVSKIVEFHSMLTPEQKNTLAEKMEKFHSRCGR
jgi:Spy/CpxP family protein refolding chaperone